MSMDMDDRVALRRHLIDALALADRLGYDIAAIHIDDALMVLPDDESGGRPPVVDYILTPDAR